ncbi:hypothetical protein POM88_051342 [Heracleum sosnowskyi]|uniref:Uncharacterized protein n=1 Tax=Heracleum sosnowskyi TaxID=360622 RepID=A0AAD8H0B2_9APIA|nr:hypothetical protein POM88_051342 [Heracleum sosnowskyi]
MIHRKRVIGIAFSNVRKALVPSGADDQICVWSMDEWKKQACKSLHISSGREPYPLVQNRVQFDQDQIRSLVIRESLVAIYEAPKLKRIKQLHNVKYVMSKQKESLGYTAYDGKVERGLHRYLFIILEKILLVSKDDMYLKNVIFLHWFLKIKWSPANATYSCDNQSLYAALKVGA